MSEQVVECMCVCVHGCMHVCVCATDKSLSMKRKPSLGGPCIATQKPSVHIHQTDTRQFLKSDVCPHRRTSRMLLVCVCACTCAQCVCACTCAQATHICGSATTRDLCQYYCPDSRGVLQPRLRVARLWNGGWSHPLAPSTCTPRLPPPGGAPPPAPTATSGMCQHAEGNFNWPCPQHDISSRMLPRRMQVLPFPPRTVTLFHAHAVCPHAHVFPLCFSNCPHPPTNPNLERIKGPHQLPRLVWITPAPATVHLHPHSKRSAHTHTTRNRHVHRRDAQPDNHRND